MAEPVYLLDTNIVVIYARASGPVFDAIEAAYGLSGPGATPLVSVVTLGEIRAFARKRGWGKTKVQQLEQVLASVVPVDINEAAILETYAEIDFFSEKTCKPARPMGQNDMWIAATAKVADAILLTTDGDFDHLHDKVLTRHKIDPKTGAITKELTP